MPGSSAPGKNTGVGYHALFQGVFPIQESKLHLLSLLPWQVGSLPLVPPGKPQWLRLCTPNAGSLDLIPGQGIRSCMPQLKILMPQLRPDATKKKKYIYI